MTLTYIENLLTNFCFFILFFMMVFYWIKTSFFGVVSKKTSIDEVFFKSNEKNSNPESFMPQHEMPSYEKTSVFLKKHKMPFIGFYGIFFSNISLTLLLILRWINSGHLPLSNLYESLLFLTWSITFIQIILEKISELEFVGVLLCPLSLLIFGFASFSLPSELQNITPLVPALQSNWLLMHVSIMILSYGTLLCGCIFSITYLFINEYNFQNNLKNIFFQKNKKFNSSPSKKTDSSFILPELAQDSFFLQPWSDLKKKVDNVSYRMISIGFSFLTIGILSGAVWANETWGSYWSWDPKETWAFITWLIFAIYLHSRLNYGWQGKKPAIIASIGFIIVWLCYLGVNLVGKGLHSYGWIQFS